MMAPAQPLHTHLPPLPPVIPVSHPGADHPDARLLHPPHRHPHRQQQAVESVVVGEPGRFPLPAARFAVFVHRLGMEATTIRGNTRVACGQITEQKPRLLVAALPMHTHPTRTQPSRGYTSPAPYPCCPGPRTRLHNGCPVRNTGPWRASALTRRTPCHPRC